MRDFDIQPSSMTINKLIEGYIRNHQLDEAWKLYEEMKEKNIPCDNFT